LDGDDGARIEETVETLSDIVKSGKVRVIGVSNETPWGVSEYLRVAREKKLPKIVTIQNQYSLMNRTFEIGLSEICLRENIGLLPYSVLNMGVLTGKYLNGARPTDARFTLWERNSSRYNPEHAQSAARSYVELAKKYEMTPAQLAVAFAQSRAFIPSVIIAATKLEQLRDCLGAEEVRLSDEILADIRQIYTTHPDPTC
jgi:aryl-alcohol dehydrogenase-like predicted oxidoreductase